MSSRSSQSSVAVLSLVTLATAVTGADQLNDPPVAGGNVGNVLISPDGAYVIFEGDLRVNEMFEVFTVPIDGSAAPISLHAPLTVGDARRTRFSGDGMRVLFEGPDPSSGSAANVIQSAPFDGATPPLFLSVSETGASAESMIVSTGSPWLLFRGTLESGQGANVYSANAHVAGSQLNLTQLGAGLDSFYYAISHDGAVSVCDRELFAIGPRPFFVMDTAIGGVPMPLTPEPAGVLSDPVITPDNSRLVYRGGVAQSGISELMSVPTDGSEEPVRLHEPLGSGQDVDAFRLTPDGSRVVFHGRLDAGPAKRIFSAPVDGSTPAVPLNEQNDGFDIMTYLGFVSGNDHLVIRARDETGAQQLYSTAVDGSTPLLRVSDPAFVGATVSTAHVRSGEGVIIFRAENGGDGRFALYSASATTAGTQQVLALPPDATVSDFEVSPDGRFIVYSTAPFGGSAAGGPVGPTALYALDRTGALPTQLIGDPPTVGGGIWSFVIAPDSRTVVYRSEQNTVDTIELFVTEIDIAAPCPADIAGADGVVDFSDLVAILAGWGENGPGADLAEPLDVIGLGDLLAVLAAWGPCH